jgi:hypothetical protein
LELVSLERFWCRVKAQGHALYWNKCPHEAKHKDLFNVFSFMVDIPFFEMPQTAEEKIQWVTCPPITLKKTTAGLYM